MSYGMKDLAKDALTLDVQLINKEMHEARFALCNVCPKYNHATKRCKLCNCYMPVKTRLTKAECPLKKW